MSRCFPFPPPGYEKARNDNTDLLKKEKHKEKKPKKDKEKEKRNRKEKHDKDRSKEKHKDKKDPKEKDKDRDKDKHKTPDGKKLETQLQNGEKLSSNSLHKSDSKDKNSLHLQELAKRLRDGDRASGSQMVQKFGGDAVPMAVERSVEEKDYLRNKIEDHRRVNGKNDTRVLEKTFDSHQNSSSFDKRVDRVEAIIKLEDKKNFEKQMEAKEKNKHKESDGKGDKHGSKEREKSKKSKDKDRVKEEKKKAKEIIEPSKDQLKLNEEASRVNEGNKESLDFRNILSTPKSLNASSSSPSGGILGKRKKIESNGYLLDNGSQANKLPRNLSFKEPVVENGKKLVLSQTNIERTPELRLGTNHIVDNPEPKLNGSIASHQPNPLKFSKAVEENGENFSEPLHPDMKYLSQILSVPKMEEWCDLDDQDWLFSSTNLKKPSTNSSIEGTRQVWAEAFRIESADISALPYVIPY